MKTTTDTSLAITADYRKFIEDLKARVATARVSSARKINHELILLYWDIGRAIVEKQQVLGWGGCSRGNDRGGLAVGISGFQRLLSAERLAHAAVLSRA